MIEGQIEERVPGGNPDARGCSIDVVQLTGERLCFYFRDRNAQVPL